MAEWITCHPHDLPWLKEQLGTLPVESQAKAIDGYSALYKKVLEKYAGQVDCESLARRIANTRLREFITTQPAKRGHNQDTQNAFILYPTNQNGRSRSD